MVVAVDKAAGATADILIKNVNGDVLMAKHLGKKETTFRGRFDMSQLADGTYQLVITNGKEETKKEVTLSTKPVTATNRVIALQ
ncbi:hypothetical protein GCM10023187_43900 [Nibrella viscosa]|uniref:Por secretion system C-terminal sorting domain-containing protein n=2 Tax=Nibrella viscosa TaxID=1084524 RepID=A0ABP8KRK3_9BACT